ncbi:MAG: hypothetical protein ACR2O5_10115 [Thiogranum sp.]
MSKHTNYVNAAVFVSVSALLGACGGGGGGGGGGNVTASSAPVTISATNAEEVAAASYKTTAGLEGSGSGATGFLTGAVTQTTSPGIDLVDVLISQAKTIPQLASANPAGSLTGVVVSETIDCFNSGSMSITFDDSDNDQQLSTGDSMSFAANNCTEDGMIMNGSVTMNNVSVSGDPVSAPHSMQLSMQANNFTITEGAETIALNGGMTIAESTNDGVLFTHSITGSSIQVTEGGVSAGLSNFSIEATEDNNTLAYTLDLNATVNSSELGGSVTIVTDTVFAGIDPNEPSSGQATITGANNSRVTLIVMGSDNVRLEIDEDGNGTAETFIDTTWGAL